VDPVFSRDGSRLAVELQNLTPGPTDWGPWGRTIVWDVADPTVPVFTVRLPAFAMSSLSPDGNRLYVATRGERPLRVYDVASGDLLASAGSPLIARHGATAVDLSPDGSTLAVAVQNRVHRYDTDTLEPHGPALQGHTEPVHDVMFSHRGRLLATASGDGALVWDARTGEPLHRYANDTLSVAFSADDRTLFTSGGAGLLQAWAFPGPSRQLALGEDVPAAGKEYVLSRLAPDGYTVARVRSGKLWFENTRTGRRLTNPIPTRDEDFIWSRDSRWLLSVGLTGVVSVRDASDGSVAARRRFEGDPVVATFGRSPGLVHVYDGTGLHTLITESLRPANAPVPTEGEQPLALEAHPLDGSVFVIDWGGSFVRVNPTSGEVIASAPDGFLSHEDPLGVISPDGSRMAVTGPGLLVRLLDVDKQEYIGTDSNTPWGESPTFAPDSSQFALVQGERIRLWDGHTGEYAASLPLPNRAGTYSITYRSDSSGLVIASTDGRTWTADTRTDTWVERACATAGRNLTDDEWNQFFPSRPYEPTCPQWPSAGS